MKKKSHQRIQEYPRASAFSLLLSILSLSLLVGCATQSSSSVSSTYTRPETNLRDHTMQKIVVFGVSSNNSTRSLIENAFVRDLDGHAVASTTLFPANIEHIDHADASRTMREKGYDGAMIVKLVDQQHTGSRRSTYVGIDPSRYYGFGRGWSGDIGLNISPGYDTRNDHYTIVASVYELSEMDEMLWSGTVLSVNPNSVSDMATDISGQIVKRLYDTGLIATD